MNIQKNYPNSVSAIILAAGKSERFGAPKVLQFFKNVPFLVRIVDSLRQNKIQLIYLILGYQADNLIKKIPNIKNLPIVINEEYEYGQFSSLQAGVKKLPVKVSGTLICLIDQPHVQRETIKRILDISELHQGKVIIPTYKNHGGHPVYLPNLLFQIIKNSPPTTSLRTIFSNHSDLIYRFKIKDPFVVKDIDTPDDLEKVEKMFEFE